MILVDATMIRVLVPVLHGRAQVVLPTVRYQSIHGGRVRRQVRRGIHVDVMQTCGGFRHLLPELGRSIPGQRGREPRGQSRGRQARVEGTGPRRPTGIGKGSIPGRRSIPEGANITRTRIKNEAARLEA